MEESKRLNFGIIGVGHIAQIGYIPSIKRLKDKINLYALCDLDEAKLYKAKEIHKAEVIYTDFEDLLSDKNVDAVIITTPNHLHYPMSLASITYGKHTLCELPVSLKLEEALELKRKISDTNRIYMPAMNYSFRPDIIKIKEIVFEKKVLGEIIHTKFIKRRRIEFSGPNWLQDPNCAGSIYHSVLIHIFEIYYFYFKTEPFNFLKFFRKNESTGIEWEGTLYLELKNNSSVSIEVLWDPFIDKDKFQIEVYCEKGNAYLTPFKIIQKHFGHLIDITPRITEEKSFYRLSFDLLLENFVNSINKIESPRFKIDDAIKILEIIEKIRH
ncbi:MAG: Gfo/Idh/MocA family oxidoreductase [Candidatus Hydrothermales bacterium]